MDVLSVTTVMYIVSVTTVMYAVSVTTVMYVVSVTIVMYVVSVITVMYVVSVTTVLTKCVVMYVLRNTDVCIDLLVPSNKVTKDCLQMQNGWSADDMFHINESKFTVQSSFNRDLSQYT